MSKISEQLESKEVNIAFPYGQSLINTKEIFLGPGKYQDADIEGK